MTAEQEWREQIREDARRRMRRELNLRASAGRPLFSDEQLGVLHQQIRDRKAA